MSDPPSPDMALPEALAEIRRLRVLVLKYEAIAAVAHGTLAEPAADTPFAITHNIPGNAPT